MGRKNKSREKLETNKQKKRDSKNKNGSDYNSGPVRNHSAFITSLAVKLADPGHKDIIHDIALPSIKEYTGATLASLSVYDPEEKTLSLQQIDTDSTVLNAIILTGGKKVLSNVSLVSDAEYKNISQNIVKQSSSLYELSFGAIPKALGAAINQATAMREYFAIAHFHSGRLYGTSLLGFKKAQHLPDLDLLNSYANIIAVALRNRTTESALYKTEANLKAIIETTSDSIWSIDREYRLQYMNEVFKKSYNETYNTHIQTGENVMNHMVEPLKSKWKRWYDTVLENNPLHFSDSIEIEIGIVYLKVDMYPIIMEGKVVGVSVFAKNITENKKAELKFLETTERNKALVDAIPDLMFVMDSKYRIKDYHSIHGEEKLYRKPSVFMGKSLLEILPEDVAREGVAKIDQVLSTGEAAMHKYSLKNQKQKIEHFEARMFKTGKEEVISIVRDITSQEEAKLNILKNEANLKAIIENSLESIWSVDNEYNIQYVNKVFADSFEKAFGKRLRKGSNILKALPPTFRDLWIKRYNKALQDGKQYTFTEEVADTNGRMIYVEVAINPIRIEGKIVGASLYGRDVTERKIWEKQLIEAKEKAEESDRLKSAFLANMSHEIRTPMNGIIGFANLLQEPGLEGDKKMEFINIIQKSGTRMLNIINDLINISKIEANQVELSYSDTNLNEQFYFIHSFFSEECRQKGIKFDVECPLLEESAWISTDKEKVYAILTNLVKNAIKFTHEGSIKFGYTQEENNFIIYVTDTGIGIPEDKKEKVFKRFEQVDSTLSSGYEGSGLGLSISKAYAEMLGGDLWFESEPGTGSSFHFRLPVRESFSKAPDKEDSQVNVNINTGEHTMLLVEDDEFSGELIKSIANSFPLVILEASNGKEAVDLVEKHPEISLVLMDIKMPVMDGEEATRIIRQKRSDLHIVAQTAFALDIERKKFGDLFDAYLTKPIKPSDLKQVILQHLS